MDSSSSLRRGRVTGVNPGMGYMDDPREKDTVKLKKKKEATTSICSSFKLASL